jgi:uncharacterized membrane protein
MHLINTLSFHPAFVHFPIALYFLEMGLLVGWVIYGDQSYYYFAELAFELGYKLMLLTMLTGFVAAGGFLNTTGSVALHFYLAVILFLVYSLRRMRNKRADVHSKYYVWWHIGSSIFGCVLLGLVTYYGYGERFTYIGY